MGLSILNERAVGPYGSRTAVGQGPRGGPWILALQPEERASLVAPRRATAADPSQPSRRVPAARATRFGGLALVLGPQRSVGALWIVDRVGRLSSTHTGTPVRIVPPGGPQISMRRQGLRNRHRFIFDAGMLLTAPRGRVAGMPVSCINRQRLLASFAGLRSLTIPSLCSARCKFMVGPWAHRTRILCGLSTKEKIS
jgi:hypothetical protein